MNSDLNASFRDIERRLDELVEADSSALERDGITVIDASTRTAHYKNPFPSWCYRFESRRPNGGPEIALVTVRLTFDESMTAELPSRIRVRSRSEIFQLGQSSRWEQTDEELLPITELTERGIADVVSENINAGHGTIAGR